MTRQWNLFVNASIDLNPNVAFEVATASATLVMTNGRMNANCQDNEARTQGTRIAVVNSFYTDKLK